MDLTPTATKTTQISMKPTFAQATVVEVDAIVALVNSAYRGEESKRGWTSEEHLLGGQRTDAGMIRGLLARPTAILWLARIAGRLGASVHIEKEGDSCYLGMLAVAPDMQNAGLGSKLISHVEDFARDSWGCRTMKMSVINLRDELLAYYERRGYRRTGDRIPFPHGDPQFGLSKRLDFDLLILDKKLM